MSDKPHEIPEADVMLGLSMEDWDWLLAYLPVAILELRPNAPARMRVESILAYLARQYSHQRAALEKTENTAGAPT